MSEPVKMDVNTWYPGSGRVWRVELVMEFATEDEAREQDLKITRMKSEISEGRKPHVIFTLDTK